MFVWMYEVPSYVDIYFAVPKIFVQEERILAIAPQGKYCLNAHHEVHFVVQVSLSHDYILYNKLPVEST